MRCKPAPPPLYIAERSMLIAFTNRHGRDFEGSRLSVQVSFFPIHDHVLQKLNPIVVGT